jgi:hypothetical protein
MRKLALSSIFIHPKNILSIENHEASNRSKSTSLQLPRRSQGQAQEGIMELF